MAPAASRGLTLLEVLSKYPSLLAKDKIRCVGLNIAHIGAVPHSLARGISGLLLSNNVMSSMNGVEQFIALETLSVSNNAIQFMEDVDSLKSLQHLKKLALQGNALSCLPFYKEFLIDLCPSLEFVDGSRIDTLERSAALLSFKQVKICLRKAAQNEARNMLFGHAVRKFEVHMELIKLTRARAYGSIQSLTAFESDPYASVVRLIREQCPDTPAHMNETYLSKHLQKMLLKMHAEQRSSQTEGRGEERSAKPIWEQVFLRLYARQEEEWLSLSKLLCQTLSTRRLTSERHAVDPERAQRALEEIRLDLEFRCLTNNPCSGSYHGNGRNAEPVEKENPVFPHRSLERVPSLSKEKSMEACSPASRAPMAKDDGGLLRPRVSFKKQVEGQCLGNKSGSSWVPESGDPIERTPLSEAVLSTTSVPTKSRPAMAFPVDHTLALPTALMFDDCSEDLGLCSQLIQLVGRGASPPPQIWQELRLHEDSHLCAPSQSMIELRSAIQKLSQRLLNLQHAELTQFKHFERLRSPESKDVQAWAAQYEALLQTAASKLYLNEHKLSLFRETYGHVHKQNHQMLMTFDNRVLKIQSRSDEALGRKEALHGCTKELVDYIEQEEGRILSLKEDISIVIERRKQSEEVLARFPYLCLSQRKPQRQCSIDSPSNTRLFLRRMFQAWVVASRVLSLQRSPVFPLHERIGDTNSHVTQKLRRRTVQRGWGLLVDYWRASVRVKSAEWKASQLVARRCFDRLRSRTRRPTAQMELGTFAARHVWHRFVRGVRSLKDLRVQNGRFATYNNIFLVLQSLRKLKRRSSCRQQNLVAQASKVRTLRKAVLFRAMTDLWRARADSRCAGMLRVQACVQLKRLMLAFTTWRRKLLISVYIGNQKYLSARFQWFLRRIREAIHQRSASITCQSTVLPVLSRALSRRERAVLVQHWCRLKQVLLTGRRRRRAQQLPLRSCRLRAALRRWQAVACRRRILRPANLSPPARVLAQSASRAWFPPLISFFTQPSSTEWVPLSRAETTIRRRNLRRVFGAIFAVFINQQQRRSAAVVRGIASCTSAAMDYQEGPLVDRVNSLRDRCCDARSRLDSAQVLLGNQKDFLSKYSQVARDQGISISALQGSLLSFETQRSENFNALERRRQACECGQVHSNPEPVETFHAADEVDEDFVSSLRSEVEAKRGVVDRTTRRTNEEGAILDQRRRQLSHLWSVLNTLREQRHFAYSRISDYQQLLNLSCRRLADEMSDAESQLVSLQERIVHVNNARLYCVAQEQYLRSLYSGAQAFL